MKQAIMKTNLKGYQLAIDGKVKTKKGGIMKQMAEILELSAAGYRVFDENGKELTMC
ncbi:hypothetical protein ACH6EH_06775 [Paenibacillus sp. JSM ZJ436]|uniref:hypothetical protein n=1 Tax=Paenibacillus sp. JSM ZJ436 TaxID=3376190 RepID=UPI0037AC66D6